IFFLPKFHYKLNFIKQCWGYAKHIYCLNPESSCEDHLKNYALAALDSVSLVSMQQFANRSHQFMDVYSCGLNKRQAAWASRKYHGYCVSSESLMDKLKKAHIV
ncbi:hypothetical protein BDZ97DRAFT_1664657, partial [Flammula alnicola]